MNPAKQPWVRVSAPRTPLRGAGARSGPPSIRLRPTGPSRGRKTRDQPAVGPARGVGAGQTPHRERVGRRGHDVEGEARPDPLVDLIGAAEVLEGAGGRLLRAEPFHEGVLDPRGRGRDPELDAADLVVDDEAVPPTVQRPGQERFRDRGREVAVAIDVDPGFRDDPAGRGGPGAVARLEGGRQRVVAEDDVGGVERLEDLPPVRVFRPDDDRDVTRAELAREREVEERLHRNVEPRATGVEVEDESLRAGGAHEVVQGAAGRPRVVLVLAEVGGRDQHPDAGGVDARRRQQVLEGRDPDAHPFGRGHAGAHPDALLDGRAGHGDAALELHAPVLVDGVVHPGPAVPGALGRDVQNEVALHATSDQHIANWVKGPDVAPGIRD